MVVGGILWFFHGYFEYMPPLGPDVVWREELGYSPIVSTELFLLYSVPGVMALLLTSWATVSYVSRLRTAHTRLKRAAQILGLLAFVFGLIAAVGLGVLFDPLTTGGLSFGVPFLGLSPILIGLAVARDGKGPYGHPRLLAPLLMLLGVIGMIALPLRPLMFALALFPLAFGTAAFALFGAGWVVLGFSLRSRTSQEAGTADARQPSERHER